jgi:hypothetical protein
MEMTTSELGTVVRFLPKAIIVGLLVGVGQGVVGFGDQTEGSLSGWGFIFVRMQFQSHLL